MRSRAAAIVAIAMEVSTFVACGHPTATAGFWYDDNESFALPARAAEKLGGLLTDAELESIKQTSRTELKRAFAGMRISITDHHDAFWRVEVRSLRSRGPLPNAGESLSFGWLGGAGAVSFDLVALKALHYAPAGASRQEILDGIARGIGRVAAHELAHQILNDGAAHNPGDDHAYEFPSPDRAAQYYGELRWTTARPLLELRLR